MLGEGVLTLRSGEIVILAGSGRGKHYLSPASQKRYGKVLCDPSQNGAFLVCLHAQKYFVPASVMVTFSGVNPVPLCDPSQKGWRFEPPQVHQ